MRTTIGRTSSAAFALALIWVTTATGQVRDIYGGLERQPCTGGAQERFYTEKVNGQWWLCTPAGHAFWQVGIYNVVPHTWTDFRGVMPYSHVASKYSAGPTRDGHLNWCLQTVRRLKSWGFNTLEYTYRWINPTAVRGEWGTPDGTIPEKMPYVEGIAATTSSLYNEEGYARRPVKDLMMGVKASVYGGWRAPVADYYDSSFGEWLDGFWSRTVPRVNLDWVLGVIVDDNDYIWWARKGEDYPGVRTSEIGVHGG
jgi:hypothetical protein